MAIKRIRKSDLDEKTVEGFKKLDFGGDEWLKKHFFQVVNATEIETVPNYTLRSTKRIYSSTGTGLQTVEKTVDGDPFLSFHTDHLDDVTWVFDKIDERVVSGPVFKDSISQPEYMALKEGRTYKKPKAKKKK